jgi:hypothetical protein
MALASYTFLPWLRRGLANQLGTPAGPGASRGSLSVALAVASAQARTPVPPVTVELVGPGDITGMQARQVIRTEPRAGITDFEPNYLAAIDFYDEDFPWRYSPLAPDSATHRLAPWILLVLLKEGEFMRNATPGRPLQSFVLTSAARRTDLFPVAGQEWAWAHVHLNAALGGTPGAPDLVQLAATLGANPDTGYARLLSPRRLEPNSSYTACVVPAFEVGRQSGLGLAVADTDDGTVRSWSGAAAEFPIYYEWSFRTGVGGDFEALVRALVPRDMDSRVGIRDLDIAHPGFGADGVTNPPGDTVGLEGALLAPTTVRKGLVAGSNFVAKVQPLLNGPADARASGSGDPLVAPPIYGCWHAQVDRVSAAPADAGWVNALNLDPRYRAAAGLGSRVIRENQERYMRMAWDQIGDVLAVNQKIRRAQLATTAAAAAYAKSFAPLSPERAVTLAAPVFGKVLGSATTLAAELKASGVPRATVSPALRKLLRPRGRLARQLFAAGVRADATAQTFAAVSARRLSAAPPLRPPGGATLTMDATTSGTTSGGAAGAGSVLTGTTTTHVVIGPATLTHGVPPARAATVELASAPAQPAFAFTSAGADAVLPAAMAHVPAVPIVPGDNPAAADMRRALVDFADVVAVPVTLDTPPPPLDVAVVHAKALAALEPHRAFAARFAPLFRVGGLDVLAFARARYVNGAATPPSVPPTLPEVMTYPDIKEAAYAPLDAISSDCFLPNLRLIPDNTLSLLETNQPFIESYLVGLNHEFARELLWREYPTDQRGSCFRQFWDVSSYVDREGRDPKALAEFLKDIPPLHQWARSSALGAHNHRDAQGDASQVVLVIRGALLKRYPNTFIYAQKATWSAGPRANRLVLADETGELFSSTPNDPRLRFPLYKARIEPDIHLVGFDLTLDEVRGDPRLEETAAARALVGDATGWFFVLQEAVGEPRFGLDVDIPIDSAPEQWDNLSWANLDLGGGQAIDVAKAFLTAPAGANPRGVQWGAQAADMAYILYRDPAMVAVHGRDMLKNLTPPS